MRNRKPAWWQLLLLVPAMFFLVGLEHADPVPGIAEALVDAGIIILTFVGMLAWVHVNEGLIEHYEVDRDGWLRAKDVITVYEPKSETADGANGGEGPEYKKEQDVPLRVRRVNRARYARSKENDKWDLN